ncbi:hypothetical protein EVAR_45614_1 [Eumeta japonica]|uniref:Major facilitator superfamily (MFS) profile domain-containing protein n=1 Tax=Eumeta variegata TaxID=151549 RepID=A0A4C1WFE1_EUMVA|nr:hypothetical protein EVAR_45614_1 [Eumeta japonica]
MKKITGDSNDINAEIEKSDLLKVNEEETNRKDTHDKIKNEKYSILEILNLKVLKDPVFCNICFCQAFVNFSDLMFFVLQPMLLFQYSYSTTQVATCISVGAGADLAGRCILAVISTAVSVDTRLLFYASTLLTMFLRLVMLQIHQFMWMALATGALGVLRSWLHIASPLIISSYVRHEDFPGAYALYMLAAGLVYVTFGPIMGNTLD